MTPRFASLAPGGVLPFCPLIVEESETNLYGPNTHRFLKVTLHQLCELFWRSSIVQIAWDGPLVKSVPFPGSRNAYNPSGNTIMGNTGLCLWPKVKQSTYETFEGQYGAEYDGLQDEPHFRVCGGNRAHIYTSYDSGLGYLYYFPDGNPPVTAEGTLSLNENFEFLRGSRGWPEERRGTANFKSAGLSAAPFTHNVSATYVDFMSYEYFQSESFGGGAPYWVSWRFFDNGYHQTDKFSPVAKIKNKQEYWINPFNNGWAPTDTPFTPAYTAEIRYQREDYSKTSEGFNKTDAKTWDLSAAGPFMSFEEAAGYFYQDYEDLPDHFTNGTFSVPVSLEFSGGSIATGEMPMIYWGGSYNSQAGPGSYDFQYGPAPGPPTLAPLKIKILRWASYDGLYDPMTGLPTNQEQ